MAGVETWDMDALFAQLKTSVPYENLSRSHFDLVLNMLAGRFADTRIRELRPRVSIDRLDNTVSARKGALLALYLSGGVIPDRGYFHMRHMEDNALIGELDEEFVWEARIGQTFALGTQNWRIERITHSDVFVVPAPPRSMSAPFWKAEALNRDFHFSELIGLFLEEANQRLEDPDFPETLEREHCMDAESAGHLLAFLKKQKERIDRMRFAPQEAPAPRIHNQRPRGRPGKPGNSSYLLGGTRKPPLCHGPGRCLGGKVRSSCRNLRGE